MERQVGLANNGNWDINTTANWLPISGGGGGITYLQYSVPGDSVLFDDSANGTTTVNLTTTLRPPASPSTTPPRTTPSPAAGPSPARPASPRAARVN